MGSACGLRHNYVVSHLDVDRVNWDTLKIRVEFGEQRFLRDTLPARPQNRTYTVFDAVFDTLYAGNLGLIVVPDAELGNRERILLEVCGEFGERRVCEQQALSASPKRVFADNPIDYPLDQQFERGRFHFEFEVERQRFGADDWEQIRRSRPVRGFVLAHVDSLKDASVRVPLTRTRGRFDLARLDNFREFRYALNTRLFDDRQAAVQFDVFTDLSEHGVPSLSIEKFVSRKSEEERRSEMGDYAVAAGRLIVSRLKQFLGGRRAYIFIDTWTYDPPSRTYSATLELHWRGAFYAGGWFDLTGQLSVREDGSDAVFKLTDGTDQAVKRWAERIDGEVLHLDSLVISRSSQARAIQNHEQSSEPRRNSW